jgi:ferredoxin/coenzyme F420-reducing hydrogenase delta subunit
LAATSLGIFAGGDAVTGPGTAVEAIAAGKRAAVSIDAYLRGEGPAKSEPTQERDQDELPGSIADKSRSLPRRQGSTLPVESRLAGFDEVVSGLTEDEAVQEARRCLHCCLGAHIDHVQCIACGICVKVCPLEIPAAGADGKVEIDIVQCQACGTCVAECPVQAVDVKLDPRGYIVSEVESVLGRQQVAEPLMVGLFSQYGNYTKEHLEALSRDFPGIVPIMPFGLERASLSDLLGVFRLGVDGILVGEAPAENRPFSETHRLMEKRGAAAKEILDLLGLGGARLILYTMPSEGLFEQSWLTRKLEGVKALGPNPLRKDASAA